VWIQIPFKVAIVSLKIKETKNLVKVFKLH